VAGTSGPFGWGSLGGRGSGIPGPGGIAGSSEGGPSGTAGPSGGSGWSGPTGSGTSATAGAVAVRMGAAYPSATPAETPGGKSRIESMRLRRRDGWVLLSLAVATLVGAIDALFGPDVVLTGLLVAAPLLASTRVGPLPTALVAAYAVAVAVLAGILNNHFADTDHVLRVGALVAAGAVAIWIADLARRVRSSRDELRVILEGVADGVTAQDRTGRVIYANSAALEAMGIHDERELFEMNPTQRLAPFEVLDEEGRPLDPERLPGRRALDGERPEPTVVRWRKRDTGEERWTAVKATPIRDSHGDVAMAISIMEDVGEAKRVERTQRFLAEASKVLAASLDYETTLRRVAELVVPDVADWCAVDILDEHGEIRQVALAAADRAWLPLADELRSQYPTYPTAEQGAPNVLRTGHSELYREITDELLVAAARDERHLELMRRLDMRSVIVAPMIARGRTLGTITFVATEARPRFDRHNLELAEELARRAATAVDNARLFGERSYIARALQESLLPPSLPEIEGVEVAARFRPAGEGAEVGGDFYDLFETGDSRWAVVMGDVCGKGAEAAALTALVRYTLRAAAMQENSPSAILAMLNEAMVRHRDDEQFCTVAFGCLDVNGEGPRLTVCNGGHPLPLLLRADGSVDAVGRPGTLLGVTPDPELREDSVELGPGDAVVLYTDGVTDARAPGRILTPSDLAALVRGCAGFDAAAIAEHIERVATEGAGDESQARDDVAILVLKLSGA
jgi:PAS domain S-box-containing protein